CPAEEVSPAQSSSASSPHRRLHRGLKRSIRRRAHIDHVREMEDHIRAFAYAQSDSLYADSWNLMEAPSPTDHEEGEGDEEDYVPVSVTDSTDPTEPKKSPGSTGTVMVWDMPTPFTRLLLHTLCTWYGLNSGSKDGGVGADADKRITWIQRLWD
ncbi:hypothetical protein BJ684DRAFT_21561, partial [Piptocephalis cylindrospora]